MLQEIIKNKILEVDRLKDTQSITVNEVLSMKISHGLNSNAWMLPYVMTWKI